MFHPRLSTVPKYPFTWTILCVLLLGCSHTFAASTNTSSTDAQELETTVGEAVSRFIGFVNAVFSLLTQNTWYNWIAFLILLLRYRFSLRQRIKRIGWGLEALVWDVWFLRTFLAVASFAVPLAIFGWFWVWPYVQTAVATLDAALLATQEANNCTLNFRFIPEQPQRVPWLCPDDEDQHCASSKIMVWFGSQYKAFQIDSSKTLRTSVSLSTLPDKKTFITGGVDGLDGPWKDLYNDTLEMESKKRGDHKRMTDLMEDTFYNLQMLEWSRNLWPGPPSTVNVSIELQHLTKAAYLCDFATKAVSLWTPSPNVE
ncbi:hypothetical protein K491DRAFT_723362 [Lophiostoma macrostomum CBS 122681]|uniref:Uncharacterized protein n=1 Tax=Lophiostoma macrostomum CBS 122681 TaxID=1314788 RepID=A0A6A6SID4_9PLEO|nr:hypothetical protein K491DRAFT_723362 [Lophiostoma macrostomum CBS 122681]